jgi:hypothetical protein
MILVANIEPKRVSGFWYFWVDLKLRGISITYLDEHRILNGPVYDRQRQHNRVCREQRGSEHQEDLVHGHRALGQLSVLEGYGLLRQCRPLLLCHWKDEHELPYEALS